MDYGYEGKLWLLQKLTVPADAKLGDTVTLKAAVDWLVCKDICVPEDTTLTLPLKIGPLSPDPAVAKDFAAARSLLPVASPWKLNYALRQDARYLCRRARAGGGASGGGRFLPRQARHRQRQRAQTMGFTKDGLVLAAHAGRQGHANGAR